jgi:nucleoside-triphosphatase THEP1
VLILLSGPIGSGKTTLCQRLARVARQRGFSVAGVLTPALIEDGAKVGIQAVDLCSGEMRLLARTLDVQSNCSVLDCGYLAGKTRVGQYLLDNAVLKWMASLCKEALIALHRVASTLLVFVDEMGRLELNRNGGLAPLIPLLAERRTQFVVVIVRDSLLDRLVARVQAANPRVVKLDPGCRETAWQEIAQLVLGIKPSL